MIYEKEWSTHIPLLISVLQQSTGPVLELGAGPFSTPMLYWMCFDMGREFVSYDNDLEYVKTLSKFGVIYAPDWDAIDITQHWGMAFIDHNVERRAPDAARLANNADNVVIHDSQRHLDKYFHYKDIYGLFKYKYKYGKVKPHTTVLSNFQEHRE